MHEQFLEKAGGVHKNQKHHKVMSAYRLRHLSQQWLEFDRKAAGTGKSWLYSIANAISLTQMICRIEKFDAQANLDQAASFFGPYPYHCSS